MGESERKNLFQMVENALGVTYHRLHHVLNEAPWSSSQVNEHRLEIMNKCSQRRITRGLTLIIDDYDHRKRGNFRDGVGRQYNVFFAVILLFAISSLRLCTSA